MKLVNKKQGIGWIVCKMKGDMEKMFGLESKFFLIR
ncbi:hypothetical protein protein [Bacillus cereus G9241]|nr:hypothetical protein protein [Bacillus cereus G9241]